MYPLHAMLPGMASKDVGIRIRVDKSLRRRFRAACRAQQRAASDVLRDFMQAFADKQHEAQRDLFATSAERHK